MARSAHGAGRFAWLTTIPLVVGSIAAHADSIATGQGVFQKAGCVACHGREAQGTEHAPALAGHSAQQVKLYVRSPQGKMPRFGADKLSDSELEAVAAYIAGIKAPEPAVAARDLPGALEMHHWMAHHALRSNDGAHGRHHLTHALKLVDDAERRGELERVIGLTKSKRLESAAHAVAEMLSDKVMPSMSMQQLHVRLALVSIDAGNASETQHHLQHYAEAAPGHDKRHAQELLALLGKGDFVGVRTRLAHLIHN